jgi:hypothetical protein
MGMTMSLVAMRGGMTMRPEEIGDRHDDDDSSNSKRWHNNNTCITRKWNDDEPPEVGDGHQHTAQAGTKA